MVVVVRWWWSMIAVFLPWSSLYFIFIFLSKCELTWLAVPHHSTPRISYSQNICARRALTRGSAYYKSHVALLLGVLCAADIALENLYILLIMKNKSKHKWCGRYMIALKFRSAVHQKELELYICSGFVAAAILFIDFFYILEQMLNIIGRCRPI